MNKKEQKDDKRSPPFFHPKNSQIYICCSFWVAYVPYLPQKKWMTLVQKIWPKLEQMSKEVEDGVFEQQSFEGWKYRPYQENKLIELFKTVFKMKFKFKVENFVLLISVHQFLGWNIWQISTRPFFLSFCSEIIKENQNLFISASTNLSRIFECD